MICKDLIQKHHFGARKGPLGPPNDLLGSGRHGLRILHEPLTRNLGTLRGLPIKNKEFGIIMPKNLPSLGEVVWYYNLLKTMSKRPCRFFGMTIIDFLPTPLIKITMKMVMKLCWECQCTFTESWHHDMMFLPSFHPQMLQIVHTRSNDIM